MLTDEDLRFLAATTVFQHSDEELLKEMQKLWNRKTYRAGVTFVAADQPGEVVFLVRSGTVKICAETGSGEDMVVALRGPGEVVGELSLLGDIMRSASITTAEECVLLWVSRSDFQPYLDRSTVLLRNIAQILARRLRLATAQIQALAGLNVRERLAIQLIALAREFGHTLESGAIRVPLHLSQSDLAGMIGTSRVSVNTTFSDWKDKGILQVEDKDRVTILNMKLLEKQSR